MPPMAHWPSARARTRSGRSKSAKGRRPLRTPPHGEGLAIIQSPGSDPTSRSLARDIANELRNDASILTPAEYEALRRAESGEGSNKEIFCQKCGLEVSLNQKSCGRCGHTVALPAFQCKGCGAAVDPRD